jgi:tetratricopeptide (TPR) repeat protein
LFFVLLLLPTSVAVAQNNAGAGIAKQTIAQVPSPLSLEVFPAFDIPLGDSSQWFSFGGAVDLGARYRFPNSLFSLAGGIEYSYAPVQAAASLSLAVARFGGGIQIPLASGIAVMAYGAGGYYFATYNDFSKNASGPYVAGGLGLRFALSPGFGLDVGARYENYLGLYQGIGAGAGIDVSLGNLGGTVDMPSLELRPLFPVFFKYYDDHPIGSLELKSNLKVPATNIKAQVYIKEYMDSPKVMEALGSLAPGEQKTIDLFSLFTETMLNVTEGTKVAAEITVAYTVDGQVYQDRKIETVTVNGRNAMTWDDNRKAAAYVTAKDPEVLNFARSITSSVRAREKRSINGNLQAAVALHDALDLYGLNYTPNPVTPYSEASKQKAVVDFLQFPRETFQYKAGDCSDLSILYAALFQAIGIDTAFITIPGHIFIAVDTGLSPEQAPRELIPDGQFITYKGKAWVPVEVTSIHGGFLSAWELGAKEWNENNPGGLAGFYPIQEAWTVYPAVGLPGAETTVEAPQADVIYAAYVADTQKYLEQALAPQTAKLQDQVQATGSLSAMNNLGVLYAQYGQSDKAEQEFQQILAIKPYLPAILNLGHLYYSRQDWKNALVLYQQASAVEPDNPHTLLALSRVNQELQNYADAKKSYDRLKELNPDLASQFAYLGEAKDSGSRAADVASQRTSVTWEMGQ